MSSNGGVLTGKISKEDEERFLKQYKGKPCPDCGAKKYHNHADNCDIERCSQCACQRYFCSCDYQDKELMGRRDRVRQPWLEEWPHLRAAIELGCFIRWDGLLKKWAVCEKSHPDARPDVCALYARCRWDSFAQEWIKLPTRKDAL